MATYYVSSSYTGSPSNGAIGTPWKTLSNVSANMGSFQPGDSILFKRGDTFTGTLNVSRSGSSGNPITFGAYGSGNKPKFTGTGSTTAYLFYLSNRNYITFDNLEILDPLIDINPVTNPTRIQKSKIERAFGFDGTSSFNRITNCKITAVGVGAYWVGPSNTMDSCEVGDLTMVVDTAQDTNNNGIFGEIADQPGYDDDYGANPLVISSANNTVTNNYFYRCWAHSYDYRLDGGAVEFFGNGCSNNYIAFNRMVDCIGICEWTGTSTGNKWHYNVMINNGSIFYFQNTGITNVEFYNNVVIENVAPRLVGETTLFAGNTSGSMIMKNNIFLVSNGERIVNSGTGKTHENNIYKLSGGSTLGFTLTGSELSTSAAIFASTAGSNAEGWDLRLTAASPAINFGQNLSLAADFAGTAVSNPPDAGAFEFVDVSANPIVVTAVQGPAITCFGGTTTVTVSATGGTPPYIGTGIFTENVGTKNYTVTDSLAATGSTSTVITHPTAVAVSVDAGIIVTSGTTFAVGTPSGGTAPYSFKLGSGVYQSDAVFTGLYAGTYSMTVKDSKGCTATTPFTVTITNAKLTLDFSKVNATCKNKADGSLTIIASGGTPPYTYSKNGAAYTSQSVYTNLSRGIYTMRIKDSTGKAVTKFLTVSSTSSKNC